MTNKSNTFLETHFGEPITIRNGFIDEQYTRIRIKYTIRKYRMNRETTRINRSLTPSNRKIKLNLRAMLSKIIVNSLIPIARHPMFDIQRFFITKNINAVLDKESNKESNWDRALNSQNTKTGSNHRSFNLRL